MKQVERDNAIISKNRSQIQAKKDRQLIKILRHRHVVQKALEMIKARTQDPPTLGELASSSRLSPAYFSHVFKAVTGTRFQDYLMEIRLNSAKDLLRNINLRIKTVCHETGFKNPNHFCRVFRKKTGLNPTNWRVRNLHKKA